MIDNRGKSAESLANLQKGKKFKPGQSGNQKGRPALPLEIKEMKESSLRRAVEILYEKIHDDRFMGRLKPRDLSQFLETAFDRFGLPKVTKAELSGSEGGPLNFKWQD